MTTTTTTRRRLFAISDIHTDLAENARWIASLDSKRWKDDALIVAGDVSENETILVDTLMTLKSKFARVFYCAGNHDVWVVGEETPYPSTDSFAKLDKITTAINAIGIETEPALFDARVWIVPLYSWYSSQQVDAGEHIHADLSRLKYWRDFSKCCWLPAHVGTTVCTMQDTVFDPMRKLREATLIRGLMLERNEERLDRMRALLSIRHLPVVSFSHFLPRADLNPTRFLKFPELVHVSVCHGLDDQIRSIGAKVHVFGHTHIKSSRTLTDNMGSGPVLYVQNALGYPGEVYAPRFENVENYEIVI